MSTFSKRYVPRIPVVADIQSLTLLTRACTDLKEAKHFRELLNVILVMGNYLNGTNYAGGAFGFKVASINRVRRLDLLR